MQTQECMLELAYETQARDRKSTRLNSSHGYISYAAFCLKQNRLRRAVCLVSEARQLTVSENEGVPPEEGPEDFRTVPFTKLLSYYLWLRTLGVRRPIANL